MKTQLTAREVSNEWRYTKQWSYLFELVFFLMILLCVILRVISLENFALRTAVVDVLAVSLIVAAIAFLVFIYGLIRYGKTGRLIERWVKITGEPIENFPMSTVSRRALRAWAKEELEKRARRYAACEACVQDYERSYKNALTAPYPPVDIKPSGVRELEGEIAGREADNFNHRQRLEESKRRETQARKRYDDWWDLLRDLEFNHVELPLCFSCLLPINPTVLNPRHFKNPAEFSAWLRVEDARRKKAEQYPESQTGLASAGPGPALADPGPPPLTNSK